MCCYFYNLLYIYLSFPTMIFSSLWQITKSVDVYFVTIWERIWSLKWVYCWTLCQKMEKYNDNGPYNNDASAPKTRHISKILTVSKQKFLKLDVAINKIFNSPSDHRHNFNRDHGWLEPIKWFNLWVLWCRCDLRLVRDAGEVVG